MKKLLFGLLLLALPAFGQQATCVDTTLSATGRTEIAIPGGSSRYVAANFSYRTTGSPTGVSISIDAGNAPTVATQTPFEQIAAVTDTTGANMGKANGPFRHWYANVGTLSGGTTPTIILTSCFNAGTLISLTGPTGVIAGSGTSGTLAKFTGANAIGDSVLDESGGNLSTTGTLTSTGLTVNGPGDGLAALNILAAVAGVGAELRTAADAGQYLDFTPNSTDDTAGGTPDFGGRIGYNIGATVDGFEFYTNKLGPFFRIDSTGAAYVETSKQSAPLLTLHNTGDSSLSGISLLNDASDGGSRNWSIVTNSNAFGDFALRQSNAKGGDPVATGTSTLILQALSTGIVLPGNINAATYSTATNCADPAGDAACGAAPAGAFVIDATDTDTVVSTTAVSANSQIFIQEDSSLSTRLSVTCNTTIARLYAVTARAAGTSFTVTASAAPVTNPACMNYWIVN